MVTEHVPVTLRKVRSRRPENAEQCRLGGKIAEVIRVSLADNGYRGDEPTDEA